MAPVIAQLPQLSVQHHAVFQPPAIRPSMYSVYESNLDARRSRALGRIASGDFRYFRTVLRDTSSSRAIPRIEQPDPFIS